MTTLNDLEIAARNYAASCKAVRNIHEDINEQIDKIKNKYIDGVKKASIDAGEKYQTILNLLEEGEHLFSDKKKSITLSGVRIGFKKQVGRLEIANEANSIKLLRTKFESIAEPMIATKETLIKKALQELSADVLKKIGVSVTNDSDKPYVKLTDDEVQKLIEAMIAEQVKKNI